MNHGAFEISVLFGVLGQFGLMLEVLFEDGCEAVSLELTSLEIMTNISDRNDRDTPTLESGGDRKSLEKLSRAAFITYFFDESLEVFRKRVHVE